MRVRTAETTGRTSLAKRNDEGEAEEVSSLLPADRPKAHPFVV